MPKRPDAKRVRAAVAAGDPPKSADYPDDDDWHDAQHEWLAKWSVRVLLDGPLRRRQWDDRVQEHKRLEAAAAKGGTQPPTPKRKYARRPAVPIAHKPVLAGPPRSKRPLPLSTPAYELAMGKYAVARDARRKLPRLRLRTKVQDAGRKRDARELTAMLASSTLEGSDEAQVRNKSSHLSNALLGPFADP